MILRTAERERLLPSRGRARVYEPRDLARAMPSRRIVCIAEPSRHATSYTLHLDNGEVDASCL